MFPSYNHSYLVYRIAKKIDQEELNSDNVVSNLSGTNLNLPRSNEDSIKAVSMIRSYRQRGHLIAKLDPLQLLQSDYLDELHPESFDFKKSDYEKNIYLGGVINKDQSNIKEILVFLKKTYFANFSLRAKYARPPSERRTYSLAFHCRTNAAGFGISLRTSGIRARVRSKRNWPTRSKCLLETTRFSEPPHCVGRFDSI